MNTAVEPNDEYKVLRDEMLNLFTRIFLVFGAEVAAVISLFMTSIGKTDPLNSGLILLLAALLVVAGLLLSLEFYQNLYSIGSYICVYFEDPNVGWHMRSRHMRIELKHKKLKTELSWIEKINEPRTLSVAYALMIVSLPAMQLTRFGVPQSATGRIVLTAIILLCGAAIYLLWHLRKVYTQGSLKWIERWSNYKKLHPSVGLADLLP